MEKLAEVDMIVADLERANSRVAALERRNVRIFRMVNAFSSFLIIDIRRSFALKPKLCVVVPNPQKGKYGVHLSRLVLITIQE